MKTWPVVLVLALVGCRAARPEKPDPVEDDPSVSSVGIAVKSSGKASKRATTRNGCYAELSSRVLRRIGELQVRHKHFAHLDPEDLRWQPPVITHEKLWIAFRYENGVDCCNAATDVAALHPTPKAFLAPDAVALRAYFFIGPWKGDPAVKPKTIGELKIVAYLDAQDAAVGKLLTAEVEKILDEEAASYDRRCEPRKR